MINAAKYLGVAPWDLMEKPVIWREWASQAQNAENSANNQKSAARERKAKVKGGR